MCIIFHDTVKFQKCLFYIIISSQINSKYAVNILGFQLRIILASYNYFISTLSIMQCYNIANHGKTEDTDRVVPLFNFFSSLSIASMI